MSTDNERKDIFHWLKESFGFPKDGDISLLEVHNKILNVLSSLLDLRGFKRMCGTISEYQKLLKNGNAERVAYLWVEGENDVANLVYSQDPYGDPFYIIRVDVEGVSLVSIKGNDLNIRVKDYSMPFCDVDLTCCDWELGLDLDQEEVRVIYGDLNTIILSFENPQLTNEEMLQVIIENGGNTGWMDRIYAPFFSKAFECICYSVLSGEYAMDDGFSQRVRTLAQKLRNSTLFEGPLNYENLYLHSWLSYLSNCIVTLSQILDEYNLFCIQIDAQVDKEPSSILRKTEEYYDRHDYVNSLYDFMSINSEKGFLNVNPMLLHFFLSFLDMARIDQNFYFSSANFASLMYMRELLQDDEILGVNDTYQNKDTDEDATEIKNKDKRGKGLVQVWKKCEKDSLVYDFKGVQDVLELARLKNGILLRKMWEGCYEELKDLTYVGQDKVLIFDPRKCREKEVGEEYHTELLLSDKLFDGGKKDRVQEFLNLTKALVASSYFEEKNKAFEEYEREYIIAKWGDESLALKATAEYYRNIMMSQTSHTSLDIRHYNSKVIGMSRDAVYYTADFRIWIKHHKYDYEEPVAFPQIHKMLLFLQNRYSEGVVCYDSEMLEGYARWCIEFLKMVSKKSPEPDSSRPSQIEETLLLLETINSLLDRLVASIDKGNYCLPFASKFRGCFFKYNVQDNKQPVLERVFVKGTEKKGYKREDFELFISAGTSEEKWNGWSDDEQIEKRKDILFIASSFVPPFNLERLKSLKTKFKIDTHKLRNEIHADYFNRLREYVKEDSMKQLEENRRSVVQILGIFAAFLALTTVALGASTANHSNLPFMSIMIGFTTCIAMFVWVLFWITRRNIRNSLEHQNKKDNITKNEIYEEVNSVVKSNIEDIKITEKKIEKDFFDIKIMIKNECKKLNGKDNAEIKKLKEKIDAQISETEQEQKNKLQEINNRIPNEIAQKIEKYRKKQNITETLRLWGPSIFISIMLMVIAVLILVKSRPVEKSELKEVKIDITSNNTVDGKKEDDTQNKAPYDLIFPHAYNYSTAPLIGMPQSLQSAEEQEIA